MVKVLKQKNIVKLLLTTLSKYGNIPNDGFLCGGAIANTLMSMEWGGDYPINDLDIFVETKKAKESNTPDRTDKLIIESRSGYHHLNAAYNHGNNYKIVSSDRDGMINVVKVFRENRGPSKNFMYILKGFDFNCVQVGIDLKSGELIYTDEFEQFLSDKQLKVTAPYTPGHTAIRLFKKIDELKCFCDVEGQMRLLSQPFNNPTMIRNAASYTGVFGMYFSIKYKVLYDQYAEQLKPFFNMVSLFDHKRYLWERRYEIHNGKSKDLDRDHVLSWLDPDRNPPQQVLDHWSKANGKIWGLIPIKYDTPDEDFVKVIDDVFSPLTLMSVWGVLYGGLKKTLVNKAKIVFQYKTLTQLSMVNIDFYDCDFDKKSCTLLDKTVNDNPTLGKIIHKYNLNLQESITLNKDISKMLNREGKWFSELIYELLLQNGNSFIAPKMEVIERLFAKEKIKLTKPLITGISLEGIDLPKGIEIKELISEYDLSYAGRLLSNCINNPGQDYKKKVKSGRTKIFVITTPKSMSALELTSNGPNTFSERWLLSYCNKTCNQYHRTIADYLKKFIHKELLLAGISEAVSVYDKEMVKLRKKFNPRKDTSTADNSTSHGNGMGEPGVWNWEIEEDDPFVESDDRDGLLYGDANDDGDITYSATTTMDIASLMDGESVSDDEDEDGLVNTTLLEDGTERGTRIIPLNNEVNRQRTARRGRSLADMERRRRGIEPEDFPF